MFNIFNKLCMQVTMSFIDDSCEKSSSKRHTRALYNAIESYLPDDTNRIEQVRRYKQIQPINVIF